MDRLHTIGRAALFGVLALVTCSCASLGSNVHDTVHEANQRARAACAAYFAHRIEVPDQKAQKAIETVCGSAEVIALFASDPDGAKKRAEEMLRAHQTEAE